MKRVIDASIKAGDLRDKLSDAIYEWCRDTGNEDYDILDGISVRQGKGGVYNLTASFGFYDPDDAEEICDALNDVLDEVDLSDIVAHFYDADGGLFRAVVVL